MDGDMTASDVIDIVTQLKDSRQMQDLLHDVDLRLAQHAMTDVPYVPDYLAQSTKVQVLNSPRIADTARQIGAIVSSYTSTVTVTPDDPSDAHKGDVIEKAYAMRRADLFTQPVRIKKRWQQNVEAYGFYHLVCGDIASPNPWSIEDPDINGCFFEINTARSMRPTMMGREYQQMMRDLPIHYDERDHRAPVYDGENWQELTLSEDKAEEFYGVMAADIKGRFKTYTVYEFDDGEYTYCVGLNQKKTDGQMLSKRKNLTGGVSYVLVPGYMTGSRELREMLLPHLWAPMNVQNQIDSINTLRFTRSMNLKPQILMERNPELYKAMMQLGFMKPLPSAGFEVSGANSIIELNGTPHMWELPSDEDLAILEASKVTELNDYISTELSLTRGDVIKESPVRNVQLALGARAQQQQFLLLFEDLGEKEILDMWKHSITCDGGYNGDGDKYALTAYNKVAYGKGVAKPGERVEVSHKDFDFEHRVNVTTASMSQEELDYVVSSMLNRKAMGIATWPQVLETVYQNVSEQEDALVDEEGYEGAAAYYGPWLQPTFEKRMAERHGILIRGPETAMAGDVNASAAPAGANPAQKPNAFPVPQTAPVIGAQDQVTPRGQGG